MPSPTPLPHGFLNPSDLGAQAGDLVSASAAWLHDHWLQIVVASTAGALMVIALHLARHVGERLCAREPSDAAWYNVLGRTIAATKNAFIVMLAARLVARYADAPAEIATTIRFLFTVSLVFQVAIWTRELILGAVERRTGAEHAALTTASGLIRVLVTIAVFAIALVVVLDNVGVNVTGLVAGLGVGGIAIGLAAQSTFADLFAALAIIFDRPFRRGDAITYDQSSGVVEAIGLKSTRIRGPAGEERIISNKHLLDKEILNNSQREYRRIGFTLGVARGTPVATLRELPSLLREIVEQTGLRFNQAGFIGFGESSYDFQLEFDSPGADWSVFYKARSDVGLAIIERFAAEGIALAYPTQTTLAEPPTLDDHAPLQTPAA